MKILVIIPAYNEAGNIIKVVNDLRKNCPQFDFIVVDDGSKDKTVQLCKENNVPLLMLPINLGLSAAVGTGMKYAYRNDYEWAIQFDGDAQHRAEYLPQMLEKGMEGYDIVIGSRFIKEKKPFSLRMLGSRVISAAMRMTVRRKVTDPTSGLRMYNRRIIKEFATEINHPPEPDTIAYLIRKGAKITEVQVEMDERTEGTSYLGALQSIKYMLRMVISIVLVQWFRKGKLQEQ